MLFFTDLDNTVIYSHRHVVSEPLVWVEELNGHHQSFVTKKVYDFYTNQNWLDVVPITTRTQQQYGRLKEGFEAFGWTDTLICNGSVLLRNGIEDQKWTEESRQISEADRPALIQMHALAEKYVDADSIISVEPFMFYVKTDDAARIFSLLSEETDQKHVTVLRDSRKVYCIPAALNKGQAVERYKARFGHEQYIAAGDSVFDIPMLRLADICLCPESMGDFAAGGEKRICTGLFSDSICDELRKIRNEEWL